MNMQRMLQDMMKTIANAYEDLGQLTKEEIKEYEELNNEFFIIENKTKELKARSDLFWVKIENKYNQLGQNLKIDGDHLWKKKEMTIKELQTPTEIPDPSDI